MTSYDVIIPNKNRLYRLNNIRNTFKVLEKIKHRYIVDSQTIISLFLYICVKNGKNDVIRDDK